MATKKFFKFNSKKEKDLIMSFIIEMKNNELSTKDIINKVYSNFGINPHKKTIENWIKFTSCKHSKKWNEEQALVDKWSKELNNEKKELSSEEKQLEEMFSQARSEGYLKC